MGWLVSMGVAQAQAGLRPGDQPWQSIQAPMRLSAWLAERQPDALNEPAVLHWRSQRQMASQQAERAELVGNLKGRLSALAAALTAMPVTGRVPLPSSDGRWLEANAVLDPVLQPDDKVALLPRSSFVTILRSSGYLCRVLHQPGANVMAYVRVCDGGGSVHAWVVQPDGTVFEHGVASWNETSQVEPAPGAWIWAPELSDAVTPLESALLARVLATQAGTPDNYPWIVERRLTEPHVARGDTTLRTRGMHPSSNDWGTIGLLQTPTARMEAVGSATLTFNRTAPYSSLKARLQPVEWLSLDFGYVSISDRRYGPSTLSGDQSYKDKSADIKLRLWRESVWVPEVAIGWRDLIGTGYFASEYLVASKRWGDLDVSAGMAFGYMAGGRGVGNPLGLISSRFKSRPSQSTSTGGTFNAGAYFRGGAAVFGGAQYQMPSDKWLLKLEYEGNDYSREPSGSPIQRDSAFNFGVVYRPAPWLDFSFGIERGNRATFTLSAHTQLDGLHTPKYLDPRRLPVRDVYPKKAAPLEQTARDIHAQTDALVSAIAVDGLRMTVTLSNAAVGYERPFVNKVLEVVHRDAPEGVEHISVGMAQRGVQMAQIDVDRRQWVKERTQYLPPSEEKKSSLQKTDDGEAIRIGGEVAAPHMHYEAKRDHGLTYGFGLHYTQNLGGPDGFLLYQLATDLSAEWRLRPDTWLSGIGRLRLLDNYGNFNYTAPSSLPRVRTHLREYLVTDRFTVPNLQLSHLGKTGDGDHFYLAYAGLLESMFAGVGVEYLYRPVNSRLAIGVDLNHVRQRDFDQKSSMRDYKVNTGHVTAYWDTGVSGVQLKLSAGQYLAGDKGVTMDVSRLFGNGVSIGAYATKTNVSAAEFGEGSFDKGIYVNIPFDAMLPRSGSGQASIVYAPLIRDGGAKLARRFTLFDLTRARDPRALELGDGSER
jgi:hypothetical protein